MLIHFENLLELLPRAIDESGVPMEQKERQRLADALIDLTLDQVESGERQKLADRQAFRRSELKGKARKRPVPLDRLESNRRLDLTN